MTLALVGLLLPIVAVWLAFLAGGLDRSTTHSRLLTLALACCVGIGSASAVTFVTLMAGGQLDTGFVVRDGILWTVVGAISLWKLRQRQPGPAAPPFAPATPLDWALRGAFLLVLGLAASVPFSEYAAAPHGQWDAWAIWNQKARFMYRAGPDWLASLEIPWSQPGHPPLVAASVARLWAWSGGERTAVPAMLSGAFALSTVAVVMAALDLRHRRAWVAGTILVAPFTFSHLASAQTADLPIGLFIVATLVMLPMQPGGWRQKRLTCGALGLAGATAGLTAWTKNEGVVFFIASSALVVWSTMRHGRLADLRWWVAGALPFLAALAWFKFGLVPQSTDYLAGASSTSTAMSRIFDVNRHRLIWENMSVLGVRWGGPWAAGALPLTLVVAAAAACRREGRIARGFLAVSAVMVCGLLGVYLLTPLDVAWLVQTTFDRVMLQIWPTIVVAACASVAASDRESR